MITENHKIFFKTFCHFLTQNNITFFLVAGSLLGAIRDKGPIKDDTDFDIGFYAEDYDKVKNLIKQNDLIKIFHCWRREITIIKPGTKRIESQIDLFFIERDEKFAYLYSSKSNPFSGIWDIEWRMKFPKEYFENLIDCFYFLPNFCIKIPKQAYQILDLEYGKNWRIKDNRWNNYDAPAYDNTYKEIAIIIPTFLRDNRLTSLITSIQKTFPQDWYKLYIIDQGRYTEEKNKLYQELTQQGHYCTFIPFNSGLSYARNYGVQITKEPYILILDDDFEITHETKIQNFIEILLSDKNIGIVGGYLENSSGYQYRIFQENKKLYYIRLNPITWFYTTKTMVKDSIPFIYADMVLNFALYKREVFNDIIWDVDLKLVEHTDFYLRLKNLQKWKSAYTKTVRANHPSKTNPIEYINFRKKINENEGLNLFLKKWNLTYNNIIYLREEGNK